MSRKKNNKWPLNKTVFFVVSTLPVSILVLTGQLKRFLYDYTSILVGVISVEAFNLITFLLVAMYVFGVFLKMYRDSLLERDKK